MTRASAVVSVMARAAQKAARGLVRDFGEVEQLQVSEKGPADFVSVADTRAEQILHDELKRARPAYGFLMEERGDLAGTDPSHRWIVDPLDGTTNFLHGIPHFCISIALEREGQVIAGVIYDPIKDETFWAERGTGAYVNERRLRVSARRHLRQAVIATGIPFLGHGDADLFGRELGAVMDQVAGIRRLGSAALDLAYVAAGRYDGYWERALSPWDLAAGIVLVREAGGRVTDMAGGEPVLERGEVVAGNDRLHGLLRERLHQASAPVRP